MGLSNHFPLLKKNTLLSTIIVFSTVSTLSATSQAQDYSFTTLGYLSNNPALSGATGVSADGSVVVGYQIGSTINDSQAYRWTKETGLVGIGGLSGNSSAAFDISADGSTVVGSSGGSAFRWTQNAGMQNLGTLPGSNLTYYTRDVSGDGSTVVGWGYDSSNNGRVAFKWTETNGMVELSGNSGADYIEAQGITPDGNTIVGYGYDTSNNTVEGYMWDQNGVLTSIGYMPGTSTVLSSRPQGISADGSTILGYGDDEKAFTWTAEDGYTSLGDLPGGGHEGFAYSSSADGSIVVGESSVYPLGDDTYEAFIWTEEGGIQKLADVLAAGGVDMTGWLLVGAAEISDDGSTIVGRAMDSEGNFHSYVATIATSAVPVPAAAWLFGSALLGLVSIKRRQK